MAVVEDWRQSLYLSLFEFLLLFCLSSCVLLVPMKANIARKHLYSFYAFHIGSTYVLVTLDHNDIV